MDQRGLADLLVRVWGLVIMVYAVVGLPFQAAYVLMLPQFGGHPDWEATKQVYFWGLTFIPAAISLAAGFWLFRYGGRIVNRHLASNSSAASGRAADLGFLEEIAVSVLGFYFLTDGLSEAVRIGVQAVPHLFFGGNSWLPSTYLAFLSACVRILLGIALLLGSTTLVGFRRRFLSTGAGY